MQILTEHVDDTLVFRFEGKPKDTEWDEAIKSIIEHYEKGSKSIIVNWLNVDFIDSNSLQVLVRLVKIQKDDPDFEFFLVTDDPSHQKTLQIFGFDKLLYVAPSEEEALEKRKTIQE